MTDEKRSRGKAAMDDLSQRIKEIGKKTTRFTTVVLLANALIYVSLLLWTGFDTDKTNKTYTNSFQFQCVAWICMYMFGYFMRVEAKQDVGLAMAHDSVDIMEKVDGALDERFSRFDRFMERLEKLTDQVDKGDHPLVKEIRDGAREMADHMAVIRKRIEKDTEPLPLRRRPEGEGDEVEVGGNGIDGASGT